MSVAHVEVSVTRIVGFSIAFVAAALILNGCGKIEKKNDDTAEETGSNTASTPNTTSDYSISFAVTSMTNLPECNAGRIGSLAYVRDVKKFYTCEPTGWGAEQVITESQTTGSKITNKWKFHIDSYIGEPELSSDSEAAVKIGDIDLIKFTDGTVWYSISGTRIDISSGPVESVTQHTHVYDEDFSFSGFFDSSKGEYLKVFKLSATQNIRVRLKINVSGNSPAVKAAMDIDGNWANDIDRSYTMVQE
ncbi:MAG: hypothetical protein EBR09_15895 [Proteobacteria bacterium]|nr:hypothetical protein [Pseudomonadota bacterium]